LLRREGLYSSNLTRWHRQRQKGQLQGLAPSKRGRKKTRRDQMRHELEKLRRDKQQLEARLEQAETIIEVQKNSRRYLDCRTSRPSAATTDDRGYHGSGRACRCVGRLPGPGRAPQ
jgi:hypothetical protein